MVAAAVTLDSRHATPGSVFISVVDDEELSASHLAQARACGAVAIGPHGADAAVTVADPAAAAAALACAYYRHPSRELTVIGVTGTNGKSSVTHLLGGLLSRLGARVGTIGTIGITFDGADVDIARRTPTTPESTDLQHLLRRFVDDGATHVVMEASSIALAERRLDGTAISVGCFTNLTHDHLDVHGSLAAYEEAKLRLFDLSRHGVANADDRVGRRIRRQWPDARTYGLHGPADITASGLRGTRSGTAFGVHLDDQTIDASVRGRGQLSVLNALAALATVNSLGTTLEEAVAALAEVPGPPGRMQIVPADQPFTIMIDYAHSPDALQQVLSTLRPSVNGRLITVFGCGGDRDSSKRPVMGRVATELSDEVIITTDNPRTEDPQQIIAEILSGTVGDADQVRSVVDRTDAIATALELARSGDLVLIAGKGSESYQIVGHEQRPYSDERAVRALLR